MDPRPSGPLQACLGLRLPRPSLLGRVKASQGLRRRWQTLVDRCQEPVVPASGGQGQGTEVGLWGGHIWCAGGRVDVDVICSVILSLILACTLISDHVPKHRSRQRKTAVVLLRCPLPNCPPLPYTLLGTGRCPWQQEGVPRCLCPQAAYLPSGSGTGLRAQRPSELWPLVHDYERIRSLNGGGLPAFAFPCKTVGGRFIQRHCERGARDSRGRRPSLCLCEEPGD